MSKSKDVKTRQGSAVAGHSPERPRSENVMRPAVDIYETDKGITIKADMPGVSKDHLDIKVDKDMLTVEGEVSIDMPKEMEAVHADVRVTHYRRGFALGQEMDTDNIDANLKDGVLNLFVPKQAKSQPRKIEVRVH